jgi:pSer/pThr/pTyr-binding forkhead associated (FHA) protein
MQAVLVMFRNDGERRSFSISRETTVIGRRQDCDLMIPLGEISRKHCRIIREADTLRLEDMGSSNGTFHNGRRVQEAVLNAGDTVQVGPVAFVVQIDGVPAEDEMTPHAGGMAAGDDEDLETLSDDLEESPAHDLGEPAEAQLEEDDDATIGDSTPRRVSNNNALDLDDELDGLSTEAEGGSTIDDLDAEIGQNLGLDEHGGMDPMDDSAAGEITIDEEKHNRK